MIFADPTVPFYGQTVRIAWNTNSSHHLLRQYDPIKDLIEQFSSYKVYDNDVFVVIGVYWKFAESVHHDNDTFVFLPLADPNCIVLAYVPDALNGGLIPV